MTARTVCVVMPCVCRMIPPFSTEWIDRMESIGAVPASDDLKSRIAELPGDVRRKAAWEILADTERRARDAGCAGIILMGLKFDSVIEEAPRFLSNDDEGSPLSTRTHDHDHTHAHD